MSVKEESIIFESFNGRAISDNPKAIFDHMQNDEFSNYQMWWSISRSYFHEYKEIYPELNLIKRFSLKWLYELGRSRFWILNARMPYWIKKPKHTIFIQTWHGTPLKKIGLDLLEIHMPETELTAYKKAFKDEADSWDYLLVPNNYSAEIFKSSFDFKKEMIKKGYPRNDRLINYNTTGEIEKIKKNLDIPIEHKVILYAPTWRDDFYYCKGKYKFKLPFDLNTVQEIVGEGVTFIIHPHYLIQDQIDTQDHDWVKVYSKHEEISLLYLISNLLITDYSSTMFDFAILQRPILLFMYDFERYKDVTRGFYFDINQNAPGPIANNATEFYKLLKEYMLKEEFSIYKNKLAQFHATYCNWEEGTASIEISKLIRKMKTFNQ